MPNDHINNLDHTWNLEGELWNEDNPKPIVRRFLQPIDDSFDHEELNPKAKRPTNDTRVLLDPAAAEKILAAQESPVRRTLLVGSYSAIRAARVAHQHRVGFWDEEGVIGYLGSSSTPDPSEDDIDQLYEDLQLFSYLPPALLPSREEFGDLAKPQKRTAVLRSRLPDLGLVLTIDNRASADTDVTNRPLIPAQAPFIDNVSTFCEDELQRILGAG